MYNGNLFRDAIISGANNILNSKQQVDELNVFPVPDGDTGTNMSMTISNAVRELKLLNDEPVSRVASVCSSALLRGARGNSGVILSLLFRGFEKGLKGKAELDAEGVYNSIRLGTEAAYKAVMKPTEGTILTVARLAGEKAEEAYKAGKGPLEIFETIVEGANEALLSTPELLPVLKKAGVVDAGGKGFCIILEGMLSVLKDGVMIESVEKSETASSSVNRNAAGEAEADITFTYCTEYIVNRAEKSDDPSALRAYLETIGDCVVVVDDDSIIKVHVHTDHPGKAIEKGITFGQLVNMKIENMRDQHERAKHESKNSDSENAPTDNSANDDNDEPVEMINDYGFVAVAAGDGLAQLFKDLGVDRVVSGGQTMNPSTDDILNAIERTPAKTVFVLPNNKNIIMAAEQTVTLSTRNVVVIPTRTIPQGVSAMLGFDVDAGVDENAIAMQKNYENVSTGQVTFAARDSDFDGKSIKKGEFLALDNGKVAFTETNMQKCVYKLIKSLVNKDTEFITLFYGCDVSDEDAESLEGYLSEKLPDVEFTLVNGGQPVYYYILSVE